MGRRRQSPACKKAVWPDLRGRGSLLGSAATRRRTCGRSDPGPRRGSRCRQSPPDLPKSAGSSTSPSPGRACTCSRPPCAATTSSRRGFSTNSCRASRRATADAGFRAGSISPSVVAELRAVVTTPGSGRTNEAAGRRRAAAAAQLARLAAAGVRGADPHDWYGLCELSDERRLIDDGELGAGVAVPP